MSGHFPAKLFSRFAGGYLLSAVCKLHTTLSYVKITACKLDVWGWNVEAGEKSWVIRMYRLNIVSLYVFLEDAQVMLMKCTHA